MSRIGEKPIKILEGVTFTQDKNGVVITGPKGQLSITVHPGILVKEENNMLIVSRKTDNPQLKALHGLTRSLIANAVFGVTNGWNKQLELSGVGFKALVGAEGLTLSVGFSHPVIIKTPIGITFNVNENKITISGPDKQLVGETAAQIRRVRPPEPYKGKGIHYVGEKLRKKLGKTAKALTPQAK